MAVRKKTGSRERKGTMSFMVAKVMTRLGEITRMTLLLEGPAKTAFTGTLAMISSLAKVAMIRSKGDWAMMICLVALDLTGSLAVGALITS